MDIYFWLRMIGIIIAITAAIVAYMAHRSAREAMVLASEASRLASLAIERALSDLASERAIIEAELASALRRNQSWATPRLGS